MTAKPASRSFRIAASALAAAPVGFAAGAVLTGRQLAAVGEVDGFTILSGALLGAIAAALFFAAAASTLPPKPVRIATLVCAGCSFAILIYLAQDFVRERLAAGAAVDAIYEAMPHYSLTLWAKDPDRRAFSRLEFRSDTGDYVAHRPGGWRCEGPGYAEHAVAVFEAMDETELTTDASCSLRASWRNIDAPTDTERSGCVSLGNALFAAADEMVEGTERKARCRRTPAEP